MNEPYKVLLEGGEAETELKKSRFIAHLKAVETEEEAQAFVAQQKKIYYDARHNCYAYVLGKDGDRVKYSDDGEPAQTGGLPIYNVLKETKVRNVCVVVTRYFGGTLLGAGPLARMYAEAAKLGLDNSIVGTMCYGATMDINSDYSDSEKIKRLLDKSGIEIVDTTYSNDVTLHVRCGFEAVDKLREDIVSLTASRAKTEITGEGYYISTDME